MRYLPRQERGQRSAAVVGGLAQRRRQRARPREQQRVVLVARLADGPRVRQPLALRPLVEAGLRRRLLRLQEVGLQSSIAA